MFLALGRFEIGAAPVDNHLAPKKRSKIPSKFGSIADGLRCCRVVFDGDVQPQGYCVEPNNRNSCAQPPQSCGPRLVCSGRGKGTPTENRRARSAATSTVSLRCQIVDVIVLTTQSWQELYRLRLWDRQIAGKNVLLGGQKRQTAGNLRLWNQHFRWLGCYASKGQNYNCTELVPGSFRIPSQNFVKKNPSKMFLALGQSEIGAAPGRLPKTAHKKRSKIHFDFG